MTRPSRGHPLYGSVASTGSGGGGGGAVAFTDIDGWGSLFDPGGRAAGAGTGTSGSQVTFEVAAVAGTAMGYAVNTPRVARAVREILPDFDLTQHALLTHLGNLTIPSVNDDNGLVLWVTDAVDASASGGGGYVIRDNGADYIGEVAATTQSTVSAGGTITDVLGRFELLDSGEMELGLIVKVAGEWTRVTSSRTVPGWPSAPAETDLYFCAGMNHQGSAAPVAGTIFSGGYSVAQVPLNRP